MSARNGDKARFNNFRRRKLAKRQRVWAFFAAHPQASTAGGAAMAVRAAAAAAPRTAQAPEPKAARPVPAQRPAAGKAPAPPKAAGEKKPRVKAAAKQ